MRPYWAPDGTYLGSIVSVACAHRQATRTGRDCGQGCCQWWWCDDCQQEFLVELPD
jgi:hypothetical protein